MLSRLFPRLLLVLMLKEYVLVLIALLNAAPPPIKEIHADAPEVLVPLSAANLLRESSPKLLERKKKSRKWLTNIRKS